MVNRQELLSDLRRVLRDLESDLRQRCDELPEVDAALRQEYDAAKEAERTAESFEEWRSGYITQIAAAWVLSCVFVRFLEDNQLVDPPRISGPKERLRRARDEYDLYVHDHPTLTYREYLLSVFDRIAELSGGREIFGKHNPIHQQRGWLSGDAAGGLLSFFQKIEPATGNLVHDFTDDNWKTRFLGDLYQDLSEEARDKYALLQTPEFVEEFILDRTLDPAIEEFGLDGSKNQELSTKNSFRMIDPACGSGHFLLGSFARLFARWSQREPGTNPRVLAQRALDSVHGVDINPYAAAIARFRLLLAALKSCGITRLADAPAFHINVVCGDSLLHGAPGGDQLVLGFDPLAHAYQSEDLPELRRILKAGHYHAVVANPPYITPKDRALNQAYRQRYSACHRKYSLSVPFMQRIFGLAVKGGNTGQITANSFMKREFGKKLIEEFLPTVDLSHVIDTSGAYIPGHGTPTVILFGRSNPPVGSTIRAVLGINGEPSTPSDPARGCVWSAILQQVDDPGSQSRYVSVSDTVREKFHRHPWSIGGGGAAELKEMLDGPDKQTLSDLVDEMGFLGISAADEVMLAPEMAFRRKGVESKVLRPLTLGDEVRDWLIARGDFSLFPYSQTDLLPLDPIPGFHRWLWPCRTVLGNRATFSGLNYFREGRPWWEWHQVALQRLETPLTIVYGEVATHNHFVLDRGGRVFKQTAPVIKLPPEATEEDHLGLLGLLNSSTACFWMKQVCHNKGSTVDQNNARQRTAAFEDFYAFNCTAVGKLPVRTERPMDLVRQLDNATCAFRGVASDNPASLRMIVSSGSPETHRTAWQMQLSNLIALQEELDWQVYQLYGLLDDDLTYSNNLPEVELGQRAFEIVLARKMAAGELQTTWFERHGSTPVTEIPGRWPGDYRKLIQRRIEAIEANRNIALIEQPEYKRRWNTEPWEQQLEQALKNWLLDGLESYFDFDGRMNDEGKPTARIDLALVSPARLTDLAARNADFMQVAELYRGRNDFDVGRLVAELVEDESVPLLPVLRYKPAAMEKRQAWERTWELQREEDELVAHRKAAKRAIEQERERVAGSLAREKKELADLRAALLKRCLEIRDLYAPKLEISDNVEPDVLCWVLGKHGVSTSGGKALDDLKERQEKYTTKKADFDAAVSKLCAADAGCQTAVRAHESIPQDPEIPVPPEYKSTDFQRSSYWRLRGKLDVPKERWISFPHCEGDDGSMVVAWAGYDHLQLARAIGTHYAEVKEKGGSQDPRLVPLLASILELVPWLRQWHNEMDPEYQMKMGDYFAGFVDGEAKELGLTVQQIRDWKPPQQSARRRRRQ